MKTAIKDFDVVLTHHWLFVVVAENDSAITAFALRKQDDKPVVVKKTLSFAGALQVCSCSIARPKTNTGNLINDTYKFVVTIATFDHCQTMFYQLNFENEELKFSPNPIKIT